MVVMGIDPGFAITGWAFMDFQDRHTFELLEFGVITTPKELEFEKRLKELFLDLKELISTYKPTVAGVETLLFHKNVKTAITVGEARGVIMLALEMANVSIKEFTPLQIKNSIAGFGRATKKQVQENVTRLCQLDSIPQPDDAADAIATAICCYDSLSFDMLVNLNSKIKNND